MLTLMLAPLLKYAEFEGRARRSEYWLFFLFQVLVYIPVIGVAAIGVAANGAKSQGPDVLVLAVILFFILPNITVTVRRLHDSDRSGFWYLIGALPLIGGIWLFVLTLLDGSSGENRFGPDPRDSRSYDRVGAFS